MASHLAGHKAGIGNAFFKWVSIFPEGFCIPLVFSVENLRTVERHGWIHPSALNSAERSALFERSFFSKKETVESTGVDPPMSLNSRRFCGSNLCILFPLTVHPGQAVFVDTVFKAAMQTAGTYDAAGNLFWINFKCWDLKMKMILL